MTHTPISSASTDDTSDRTGDEPPFPQESASGRTEGSGNDRDRTEVDPTTGNDATTERGSGSEEHGPRSEEHGPGENDSNDSRETRTTRARTEPMTIRPTRDRRYVVETDGGTYVVSLDAGSCTCPDAAIRGARCKHLRRVAMEVTNGTVPAPDERIGVCAVCGRETFVSTGAAGSYLCETHRPEPGEAVHDRETGKRLVVTAVTADRADATETDEGRLVSEYATNADYGAHEPVVEAVYAGGSGAPDAGEPSERKRYRFPASRLRRTRHDDEHDDGDRMRATRDAGIEGADRVDA